MKWNSDGKDQVFLAYTSNLVSSGTREQIRWVVEHKHVTCLVTTAGGIEEDIIKCLEPTFLSTFDADDAALRTQHLNRIGNLLVPNKNYISFEDWMDPILDSMLDEQEASAAALDDMKYKARSKAEAEGTKMANIEVQPLIWTPSTIIARLGKEINHDKSIYYWAYKNGIPVFCPAITDGSIGDMLSQFRYKGENRPKAAYLTIDINRDIHEINNIARRCALHDTKMGAVILGGGIVKHHVMNACLQGGGADAVVYINTADEYDGSDAGATPSEAVSWGKLKAEAKSVKVHGDATLLFPALVAASWAYVEEEDIDPVELQILRAQYRRRHRELRERSS